MDSLQIIQQQSVRLNTTPVNPDPETYELRCTKAQCRSISIPYDRPTRLDKLTCSQTFQKKWMELCSLLPQRPSLFRFQDNCSISFNNLISTLLSLFHMSQILRGNLGFESFNKVERACLPCGMWVFSSRTGIKKGVLRVPTVLKMGLNFLLEDYTMNIPRVTKHRFELVFLPNYFQIAQRRGPPLLGV